MSLEQADFDRLIAEHGAVLYRVAYRMLGDRHEAEDVVQEAFRSAWRGRERFDASRSERAWLVTILRRRAADRWRSRRLPVWEATDSTLPVAEPVDPWAAEFTDEMQAALGRLSADLRECLLLVVVGELTHQEAADELGIPLGTVLSRVSRARSQLREHVLSARKRIGETG